MFKTKAKEIIAGNYTVKAVCKNGHTSYKKAGDGNPYKCAYCDEEI